MKTSKLEKLKSAYMQLHVLEKDMIRAWNKSDMLLWDNTRVAMSKIEERIYNLTRSM